MKTVATKVRAEVNLPVVNQENISNIDQIHKAINGPTLFGIKNGEVGIRSYGFLASCVLLSDDVTQASLVKEHGAVSSRLSKANTTIQAVIARDLGDGVTATYGDFQDAIETIVREYDSLNAAHADLVAKKKGEPTLESKVASLFKWADENDIARDDVIGMVNTYGK